MKKILFLAICMSSLAITSCSSDDTISNIEQASKNNDVYSFTYLGKIYTSTILSSKIINNEEEIILSDPKVNDIYQKIVANQNSAMYINSSNEITFFDSYQDLKKTVYPTSSNSNSNVNSTRTNSKISSVGNLIIYEHDNYTGSNSSFSISDTGLDILDLGLYGFHDRISSFQVSSSINNVFAITFFRDQNYGGRSLTFDIGTNLNINSLRGYKLSSAAGSWNDQATSLKVFRK